MSKELAGIIGLFISLAVATASVIGVVQTGAAARRLAQFITFGVRVRNFRGY